MYPIDKSSEELLDAIVKKFEGALPVTYIEWQGGEVEFVERVDAKRIRVHSVNMWSAHIDYTISTFRPLTFMERTFKLAYDIEVSGKFYKKCERNKNCSVWFDRLAAGDILDRLATVSCAYNERMRENRRQAWMFAAAEMI